MKIKIFLNWQYLEVYWILPDLFFNACFAMKKGWKPGV